MYSILLWWDKYMRFTAEIVVHRDMERNMMGTLSNNVGRYPREYWKQLAKLFGLAVLDTDLVGGLDNFIFFHFFPYIGNVIIPTDELIFFRGVGIPPSSDLMLDISSDGVANPDSSWPCWELRAWDKMGCSDIPGLVNIQKTMERSTFFKWENSLFLWPFSIAMLNYQRVSFGNQTWQWKVPYTGYMGK